MSKFYQDSLDLKYEMELSDSKSEEAKERDYKIHNEMFYDILFQFGEIFLVKEEDERKMK